MKLDFICAVVTMCLMQYTTALSSPAKEVYTNPQANSNLGRVLHEGDKTYVAGVDYLSVILQGNPIAERVSVPVASYLCAYVDEGKCINAITILERIDSDRLLVCGTNAISPLCYHINTSDPSYPVSQAGLSARLWLNHDPSSPLSSLILNPGPGVELYLINCPIESETCRISRQISNRLSTESVAWFSAEVPEFLNAYSSEPENDKIYFLFREEQSSFQYDGFTATGDTNSYAMVGRVCAADRGGSISLTSTWMTFMKARLLCPFPGGRNTGSRSTYYDYLRATYKIKNILYGVFSFPSSWGIQQSAVCAYDLRTIDATIDGTVFPNNVTRYFDRNSASLYKTFTSSSPFLPGQCPGADESTKDVSGQYENFVRTTSLINKAVSPIGEKPLHVSRDAVFDFIVGEMVGQENVLYLVKEDGSIRKIRVSTTDHSDTSVLSPATINVTTKILSASLKNKDLVLVTGNQVLLVATTNCSSYNSCESCVSDPHCSWSGRVDFMCKDASSNDSGASAGCLPPPSAPGGLTVSKELKEVIWNASVGDVTATGYVCKIMLQRNGSVVHKIATSNLSAEIPESILKPGVKYLAKVWAINQESLSPPATYAFVEALRGLTLQSPMVSINDVTISWGEVDGAISYHVTVSETDTNTQLRSYALKAPSAGRILSINVGYLAATHTYKAEIFAISADGVRSDTESASFDTIGTAQSGALGESTTSESASEIREQPSAPTASWTSFNNPLLIVVVPVAVAFVIFLGLFIQNRWAIGPKTKHIWSGNSDKMLKRKFGVIWLKYDRPTTNQA
ncbi:semaphorin-1A-like isoform X3 [Clavelina lepadiformis]|uniref:semaphorin-1A-like isoform X3 n=1 Tax=Clavelina lepadiformis TaxID=159417 RepID=UPI0040431491